MRPLRCPCRPRGCWLLRLGAIVQTGRASGSGASEDGEAAPDAGVWIGGEVGTGWGEAGTAWGEAGTAWGEAGTAWGEAGTAWGHARA